MPAVPAIADMTSPWTTADVRALLAAIYGGHRDVDGTWHPKVTAAASRRRVSERTVQRWISGPPTAPAHAPKSLLTTLLRSRRPSRKTLQREELEREQQARIRARRSLGRGRGNLAEYKRLGWLDEYLLLILEEHDRPLRRVAVVRNTAATKRRAQRGSTIIDFAIAPDRFVAETARLNLLLHVQPWRIDLKPASASTGHTQLWLASAPLPILPTHLSATDDEN